MKLIRQVGLMLSVLTGCGGNNSPSPIAAPGAPTSAKTATLEAGAALLQDKEPLKALNSYMDGFHFYSGNMKAQMEAHHYCALLNEDVTQCVIYDGNTKDAKIMGIEYIVSAKVFAGLAANEKALWHSHVHEVRSGQLIAPGIPELAEKEFMRKLAGTYGKTWHTWHTDQDKTLPLGAPMLMMGFTQDGQTDVEMVAQRDARFGIDSNERRNSRADIEYPSIDPSADAWQSGRALQVGMSIAGGGASPPAAHH